MNPQHPRGARKAAIFMASVAAGWLGLLAMLPNGLDVEWQGVRFLSFPSWAQWWRPSEPVMTAQAAEEWVEKLEVLSADDVTFDAAVSSISSSSSLDSTSSSSAGESTHLKSSVAVRGSDSIPFLIADVVARDAMLNFFRLCADTTGDLVNGKPIHVFHFGDSQIEGDRFTSIIREEFQSHFGGSGPGWLGVSPPSPSMTVNLTVSDPKLWRRETRFMTPDSLIDDERFGWLASRSSCDSSGTIQVRVHPRASLGARSWDRFELQLDSSSQPLPIQWQTANSAIWHDTLIPPSAEVRKVVWREDSLPMPALLEFPTGMNHLLGAGLWSQEPGVIVHNIPMRGSSGTLFRKLDADVLAQQAQSCPAHLVILQYGGNAVPYLQDVGAAERYGRWFSRNIQRIRELMPQAAFVIISNADMAENVEGQWLTKPMVAPMRDALLRVAEREHAVFFDLFEAMGGHHSMAGWVQTDPPLAGADHIHFTRRGSNVLARLFMESLFQLQNNAHD